MGWHKGWGLPTLIEAEVAARNGLKDWMNEDDSICKDVTEDEVWLFVTGGSEGPSDACARIYPIRPKKEII